MVIKLSPEFSIDPDKVLENHTREFSIAVPCTFHRRGFRRSCFALVCDPSYPPRISEIEKFRTVSSSNFLTPLTWFVHKTPFFSKECPILIFDFQRGLRPLLNTLSDKINPANHNWVIDNLLVPGLRLIQSMDEQNVTHRGLMPTNIFGDVNQNHSVVFGESLSAPVGSMQHEIFEFRHYAMAERFGRGPGSWQNDIFALGVTALSLFLGEVPCIELTRREIITKRLQMPTLHLYTNNAVIPERLMVLLRGMIQDNPSSLMTPEEHIDWIFKNRSVSRSEHVTRFSTALRYQKVDHHSLESLAFTVSQNWNEARIILGSERVIVWVMRSLAQKKSGSTLTDSMRQISEMDPNSPVMDIAIAKILILMDKHAPIRLQDYSVTPDGLLSHAAVNIKDSENINRLKYILRNDLLSFWADQQGVGSQDIKLSHIFAFQGGLTRISKDEHIELLLYEYHPDLPCCSVRTEKYYVLSTTDCVLALEKESEGKNYDSLDFLLDEHIYAFFRSRSIREGISFQWADVGPRDSYTSHIAGMSTIVSVQRARRIPGLKNLFEYLRSILIEVSKGIKLSERREQLLKQLRSLRNTGQLQTLMLLWRGGALYQQDKKDYDQAIQHYRGYIMREKGLMMRREDIIENSRRLGHNLSALISSIVSLGGLLLLLVTAI